jgi:hypothetical protein
MDGPGIFVYLLEEDAVLAILPGWPAGMQVAVCLHPGGGCDLAVHHRNEVARVLDRLATLHHGAGSDLCVAPQVEGYPTRKVLFSEEQQLLAFVADSPHLVELAADYALNYRFALDEGLDADTVTGSSSQAAAAPQERPQPMPADVEAEQAPALSSRSRAFITHLSLPSGYAAPISEQRPECLFVEGHLALAAGRVRLTLAPEASTGAEVAITVARIGCRDDFARFVLPRAALDGWSLGQSAVLDMSEALFPAAVVDHFMRKPHLCSVTITTRGIFVTPVEPVSSAASGAEAVTVRAARPRRRLLRRRLFKSVHVAVAVLVIGMVVTGHFAAALDRSPVQTAALPGPSAGATAALDLIAAMARQEPEN